MSASSRPISAPVQPGDILAGKYRVERVLGRGGMGVVVAARHLELDQEVAVKFMLEAARDQVGAAERFLREARAAVRLRGEHVAKVMDVGKLDSGAPYMVMEFLAGNDLEEVLRQRRQVPVPEAADYVIQACAAMAEAHAQGIIHRDLKPANLFLTRRPDGRPSIKVLDFGISKLLDSSNDALATSTGVSMGTPAYMAPEQMRSARDADARADIWSLGAILYHLIVGRLPFYAETITELMLKVLAEDPIPLGQIAPHVPLPLANVIYRCLARDRDHRVQTAIELADLLAPFATDEGRLVARHLTGWLNAGNPVAPASAVAASSAMVAPAASAPATISVGPSQLAGEAIRRTPQGRRGWLALALGASIAIGIAIFQMARGEETAPPAQPVAPSPAAATPTSAQVDAGAPLAAGRLDAAPPQLDAAPAARDATMAVPKKTPRPRRRPARDEGLFDSID